MKIFKRKENNAISVQTAVTKRITHPFIDIENYNPMSRFKFKLYSSLREAVPVIDASISKLVRLIGTFDIECDDEDVSFRINDFLENVKVGVCSTGINSFLFLFLDQLLTYGTSVGEIVPNANFDNIEALYNASLKNVELRCDQESLKLLVYKKSGGKLSLIDHPEFIVVSSFNSVDLFNAVNSNCVKNGELTNSISISCKSDYNPYYELNCNNNINQHLDPEWS